ncbi:MAG TPA: YciI family protein [Pseudonocardiaceae bacterium]
MTQYLLAVHHPDSGPNLSDAEFKQSIADVDAVNTKLQQAGALVFAGGLYPAESATVVRQSGSDVLVTDGPYAETKEHMGGFWIIEAADRDAALDWAKQATVACRVPVEIRAFMADPPESPRG